MTISKREHIALFIFVLFCGYMGMNTTPPTPAAPVGNYKTADDLRYEAERRQFHATETVKISLIDPDSARFRNVINGLENAVCGMVNSKNRFGGYGGFRHFIYIEDGGVIFEGAPTFKNYYARYCFNPKVTRWGFGAAHAAQAQWLPAQPLKDRIERWARFYMTLPVVRVDIGRRDRDGYHDVMIEMRAGTRPITMEVRIHESITEPQIKQMVITVSMAANDAALGR